MTPIKILRNFPISLDGISVQVWPAGSRQVVTDDILTLLINEGACEIVENKALAGAPENKARKRGRPRKGGA